jgi:hypothetical protein
MKNLFRRGAQENNNYCNYGGRNPFCFSTEIVMVLVFLLQLLLSDNNFGQH